MWGHLLSAEIQKHSYFWFGAFSFFSRIHYHQHYATFNKKCCLFVKLIHFFRCKRRICQDFFLYLIYMHSLFFLLHYLFYISVDFDISPLLFMVALCSLHFEADKWSPLLLFSHVSLHVTPLDRQGGIILGCFLSSVGVGLCLHSCSMIWQSKCIYFEFDI